MKVGVVTTWPPHRDGIAYYSWKLYNEIGKRANVTIIANRVSNLDKQKNNSQSSTQTIRCWKRGSFLLFPKIFRESAKSNVDVIHVQHGWLLYGDPLVAVFFPLLLAGLRLFSRPLITTFHSVIRRDAFRENSAQKFTLKILSTWTVFIITKLTGWISSKIVVHNDLMKEYLVKEYYLDPDKIAVISHGVDRAKKIKDAKIVPGSIMFFGHLRPMKGIENLLQAFRLLLNMNQNAKLLIVGSPHAHDKSGYLANLRHLVQQQGLDDRVRLESFVSEEELSELISTSQIIVFPYLDDGFIEASGAIARMMDYGKPVVCTNIPKFKGEFYDQSRCIMIEKENAATLAEKLNSLIRDAHLREEKAKCLKEVAQTRYWNIVAKRHIELYKSCLLKKLND